MSAKKGDAGVGLAPLRADQGVHQCGRRSADHGDGPGAGIAADAGTRGLDAGGSRPDRGQRGLRGPGALPSIARSGWDLGKVNVNGGAIASAIRSARPVRAYWSTCCTKCAEEMRAAAWRRLCIGGGQGRGAGPRAGGVEGGMDKRAGEIPAAREQDHARRSRGGADPGRSQCRDERLHRGRLPKAVPAALAGRMGGGQGRPASPLPSASGPARRPRPELDGALAAGGWNRAAAAIPVRPGHPGGRSTPARWTTSTSTSPMWPRWSWEGSWVRWTWRWLKSPGITEDGRAHPLGVGRQQQDLARPGRRRSSSRSTRGSPRARGHARHLLRHGPAAASRADTDHRTPATGSACPTCDCPPEKVVAVVETNAPDRNTTFKPPDAASEAIAGHILEFLRHEVRHGKLPELLPIQSGVGNVANAVMAGLEDGPFRLADRLHRGDPGRHAEAAALRQAGAASATALSLSAEARQSSTAKCTTTSTGSCCARRKSPTIRR